MTQAPAPHSFRPQSRGVQGIGLMIFFSRWMQAPLYIGLIVAQVIYVVVFMVELSHLGAEVWHSMSHPGPEGIVIEEAEIMLAVLGLIDVVMIANLLIMVIIGGYETFVSKIRIDGHPDQPEWLSHVNANVLKVKLAMAIVGISSIHLLKTFIEVGDLGPRGTEADKGQSTWDGVFWQVVIHMVFILSAIALAWIDRMSRAGRDPVEAQVHASVEPSTPPLVLEAHAQPDGVAPTPAGHLLQLGQLRDAGVVTDDEFETKKSELLARI